MPEYALFLRGINVGGNKMVPMAGLRALIAREGFTEAATLLHSGNAVFRGATRSPLALEGQFERAIARDMKVECDCFVRTSKEWETLMTANPFPSEAKSDPARLIVFLLRAAPAAGAIQTLRAAIVGRETVELAGRQLYGIYPDGMGRSKLTLPVIERHLGAHGTGRNWNTIVKVAELLTRSER